MKKIKKIFLISLVWMIIFSISFLIFPAFAKANEDDYATSDFSTNITKPDQSPDAQEEGAAADFSESNISNQDLSQPSETPDTPQTFDFPEVKSYPNLKPMAFSSTICNPVLNEVMPNPTGYDTAREWVELFNPCDVQIDLSGFKIQDNDDHSKSIIAGDSIEPNGFYLIENFNFLNNDVSQSNPEQLDLLNSSATVIDTYYYDVDPIEGTSYGRYPDGSENWTELYPTPGEPNYSGFPEAGVVFDGSFSGEDIDYTNINNHFEANWSGFSDETSGIDHYEFALGTLPGASDVYGWEDTDNELAQIDSLILPDAKYYFSVKAVNFIGNESATAISDGFILDTVVPSAITPPDITPADQTLGVGGKVTIKIFTAGHESDLIASGTFNGKDLSFTEKADPDEVRGPWYEATYETEANDLNIDGAWLVVTLTDLAGNSSYFEYQSQIVVDTTPPKAPGKISVFPGEDYIKISWQPVDEPDLFGYNIYRAQSPFSSEPINQDIIQGTAYKDYDVAKGVNYHYKVTAIDLVGNETDLNNATQSIYVQLNSINQVVGRLSEPALKTTASVSSTIASGAIDNSSTTVQGSSGKVKAEKSETEGNASNRKVINWPLIISVILSGLIVLAGFWYYWSVSRQLGQNESVGSRSKGPRTKRQTSKGRGRKR